LFGSNIGIISPNIDFTYEPIIQRYEVDLCPRKVFRTNGQFVTPDDLRWRFLVSDINNSLKKNYDIYKEHCSFVGPSVLNRLQSKSIKILFGQFLSYSLPWIDITEETKLPFVLRVHDAIDERCNIQQSQITMLSKARKLIVASKFGKKKLASLGIDAKKIKVVRYGLKPRVMSSRRDKVVGDIIFLSFSNMHRVDDSLLVLKAFERVVGEVPHARLNYVGSGPFLPDVEDFVIEHGLTHHVSVLGAQWDEVIDKLMDAADIYIQPSFSDTYLGFDHCCPGILLEAMGFGLPVISIDQHGISETIMNNVTGLLTQPGDWVGLSKEMIKLALNSKLRKSIGASARQHVRKNLLWKIEKETLLSILMK
jgi:glycosyltransferase involved in cell wall biosynthesis